MRRLEGKRLLMLGTSRCSVDMVKYAKEQGAYVLVTDYLPTEKSAAKQYADDTAMVSTIDIETLCKLAKDNQIDGVFCGVSETNLESARQVCEVLGLPIYYTQQQWNTFQKKDSFRQICRQYGVSVPQTYFIGNREQLVATDTSLQYPVIVKPVDSAANVGISVCRDPDQLQAAAEYAFSKSDAGRIIIEQFVEGVEVNLTYTIQNKQAKLVCMGTKYICDESGMVCHAYMFPSPSPCVEEFLQDEDAKVQRMLLGQGLDNCTLFIQGMYADHRFYLFESGLRLQGTASYRITKRNCGQSNMEFMIDNALGVPSDYDINLEDVTLGGKKCVTFSLLAKGGTLARMEGFEKIPNSDMIIAAEQRYQPGDYVANDGTLKQIVFQFVLCHEDINVIVDMIQFLKKTIKAYDPEGNSALLDCFDVNRLLQ